MSKCCECVTTLSRYNKGLRCFLHQRLHTDLRDYSERREIKTVGTERWAVGQTTKRNTRVAYVREVGRGGITPWDSSLEELYLVDPKGVTTFMGELLDVDGVERDDLAYLDRHIDKLTEDEVTKIEDQYPTSNVRTKWIFAKRGERYLRFRSAVEEDE